jgi:DNA-directed RNA polymerase specialized sigma24 family protein
MGEQPRTITDAEAQLVLRRTQGAYSSMRRSLSEKDKPLAGDAWQSTWEKLQARLQSSDEIINDEIIAWYVTTFRNNLWDILRRENKSAPLPEIFDEDDESKAYNAADAWLNAEEYMQELAKHSYAQLVVVTCHRRFDMSYEEIADQVIFRSDGKKASVHAVELHDSRGMKFLRNLAEKWGERKR